MKRNVSLIIAPLLFLLAFALPATAADVAQGKCLSYDQNAKTIVIEEYDTSKSKEHPYGKSTGKQMTFDVANALIGITPQPGDILRVAYTGGEKGKSAVRVMNVSKQDIMKK